MVKGNNLPSLFLIGSDRFSASGTDSTFLLLSPSHCLSSSQLTLAGKNLKFKTLVSLTNAIKFSHNLREISISSSKIDLNAAKLIADAISNHFSLQSFSITG